MDHNNKLTPNTSWDLHQISMELQHSIHTQTIPFDHSNTSPNFHFYPFQAPQLPISTHSFGAQKGKHLEVILDDDGDDQVEAEEEELGAMKEMMYKIAAMQPVDIDPATIHKPKRRNVRISDDPQSVAARHRRERISEKIRILQRLVPGGTKMDTASMLDEAIRYVKFLKRQIRLLQSPHHEPQCNVVGSASSVIDWHVTPQTRANNSVCSSTNSMGPLITGTTGHNFGGNSLESNNYLGFNHEVIND